MKELLFCTSAGKKEMGENGGDLATVPDLQTGRQNSRAKLIVLPDDVHFFMCFFYSRENFLISSFPPVPRLALYFNPRA